MKKILVLLMVMAIAMGSVFAADGSWTGDAVTADSNAVLNVRLSLDTTNIFTIGFTDEAEVTTENIDSITPKTELVLAPEGSEYTGTTNIYYGVKNLEEGKTYKIRITIGDALHAGESYDDINWTATTTAGPVTVASNGTKSGDVWTSIGGTKQYEVNYTQLAVSTDGFVDVNNPDTDTDYTGTITLTIASN